MEPPKTTYGLKLQLTPKLRNLIKVILIAFISTFVITRVEQLFSPIFFDIGNLFALVNAVVSGLLIGLASRSAKLASGGGALGWLLMIMASVLTRSEVFPSLLLLGQHTLNEVFLRALPLLASLGLATLIGYLRRETTVVQLEEETKESAEVPPPRTVMRTSTPRQSVEPMPIETTAENLPPEELPKGEESRPQMFTTGPTVEKVKTPKAEMTERLGGFPEMKLCVNCSHTIPFESIFCPYCGRRAVD